VEKPNLGVCSWRHGESQHCHCCHMAHEFS